MNAPTVFHVKADASGYRSAVATIIRDIERTGATLLDIAENIDASRDTVSDAKYGKTTLNAVHLARLGQKYGAGFLNPYFALFGAQAAPMERKQSTDVLPIITRLSMQIAEARDPAGLGGAAEVPQERSAYLPILKEAVREGGCLVAEIERQLA
jgi:hypothetical protein